MQTIRVTTLVNAPLQRCFLLSLCVDLQILAAESLGERALGGVTSGQLRVGDSVVWSTPYVDRDLRRTIRIEIIRPYTYFRECMADGNLAAFGHEHHFATMNDGTRIRDDLRFDPPSGLLGRLMSKRIGDHLRNLLIQRGVVLKRIAESEDWRKYLGDQAVLPSKAAQSSQTPTPEASRH